jgi:hypothetical protein
MAKTAPKKLRSSTIYPPDIISFLKKEWVKKRYPHQSKRAPLPSDEALLRILTVCYHASFLREEGRRLAFRVIYYPQPHFEKDNTPPRFRHADRVIRFTSTREFSVAELHRLAPAAEAVRSLICIESSVDGKLNAWGLIDAGANWWNFIHHESSSGSPPPNRLTISSQSPGELSISSEGEILFSLRGGSLIVPSMDLLWAGVVADFFAEARHALYQSAIKALGVKKWDEEGHDNDYPQRLYNFYLLRILFSIREKNHGGTLILVPDKFQHGDSRLTDRITIKYPCDYDYVWNLLVRSLANHRKYYDLHFALWDSKKPIEAKKYREIEQLSDEREEIEESLTDCARLIASLSGVDGVLVLTDRFRVLGFGGEVIAASPTLRTVKVAGDCRAKLCRDASIEGYGTRHRSAFRFCSSFEDAVAFIVSQDGGVKATKRHGPDVILWPDVNMGSFGI